MGFRSFTGVRSALDAASPAGLMAAGRRWRILGQAPQCSASLDGKRPRPVSLATASSWPGGPHSRAAGDWHVGAVVLGCDVVGLGLALLVEALVFR